MLHARPPGDSLGGLPMSRQPCPERQAGGGEVGLSLACRPEALGGARAGKGGGCQAIGGAMARGEEARAAQAGPAGAGAGAGAGAQGTPADDAGSGEVLTEELLAVLLDSASPERYLDQLDAEERDLPDYLAELLEAHGRTRSEAIRASGVNATFGYQIFQGTRRPGRDTTLQLALGIGCTLRETQRLLRFADHGELWCKRRRDAIIMFCIEHGMSRAACDDELYRLGEQTLPAGR